MKVCVATKFKQKASGSRLSDAQQHVWEFDLTKDTVNKVATKVDEGEKLLSAS